MHRATDRKNFKNTVFPYIGEPSLQSWGKVESIPIFVYIILSYKALDFSWKFSIGTYGTIYRTIHKLKIHLLMSQM